MRAIHTQRWAYFKYFPGSQKYKFEDKPYNLAHDPGEDHKIVSEPRNADIIAELSERIDTFFAAYFGPYTIFGTVE